MTAFLNIALLNAITVVPLAAGVFLITRWIQRPALTHTLWVLVLLKLVTPSPLRLPAVLELPVSAPYEQVSGTLDTEQGSIATKADHTADRSAGNRHSQISITESDQSSGLFRSTSQIVETVSADSDRRALTWGERIPWNGWWIAAAIWLAGSLLWFAIQAVRFVRFRCSVLRTATPSTVLQQQVHELAGRLGIQFVPRVWLVDSTISPMLWGCGTRIKLLFPLDLASRLDDDACSTLLAHEMAHFVRGDQYVRLLELLATGLFWWHPVVWWARSNLEQAEEVCCDAQVVSQFPENSRKYAEALLDTIDYLCESNRALPPVASGLGHSQFLRRRLTKIMDGTASPALSPQLRMTVLLCSVGLLPWQPFVFGATSHQSTARHRQDIPLAPGVVSTRISVYREGTNSENESDVPATDRVPQNRTQPSRTPRPRAVRTEKVWATAASPDGRFILRATVNRRVLLTDLRTNLETDLSSQRLTAVAFGPGGTWFVAADPNGRVTQWDAEQGVLLRTVFTHTQALRSIAVSPDGTQVAVGSPDGSVFLINLQGESSPRESLLSAAAINCVRFSPDGRQLAVAVGDWMSSQRGEVVLLDAETAEPIETLSCGQAPGALTYASNHELIVGLWSGRVLFWNLPHREVISSTKTEKSVISAAAFSQDNPALREVVFSVPTAAADEAPATLETLRSLRLAPVAPSPIKSAERP